MTEQLRAVFRDGSSRERFRADLRNPKPGTVFQGNWQRVIIAAPVRPQNAGLADRTIADIAREAGRDPLDVLLDLGLEEDLDTGLIGRFFNAVDDGVEPLIKHKAGVIALSDSGAHLVYGRTTITRRYCAALARHEPIDVARRSRLDLIGPSRQTKLSLISLW